MKLGISMWSYFHAVRAGKIDLPGFIREAKRLQVDGVELLDVFYRDKDIAEERKRALDTLKETGLVCGVFSIGQNFAKILAEDRALELEKVRFGITEAGHYGAKVVRVFAGDVAPGITFEAARDWIVEGLVEASRIAAAHGVKLALENHGSLAGRSDQVLSLITEVREKAGNDALGANPDTGNFVLALQNSVEAVSQLATLANMVHFKDFAPAEDGYAAQDGKKWAGTALGEGSVDLKGCHAVLKDAGFQGWLNIEYEAPEDPMTGVPRSVAYTRALLGR